MSRGRDNGWIPCRRAELFLFGKDERADRRLVAWMRLKAKAHFAPVPRATDARFPDGRPVTVARGQLFMSTRDIAEKVLFWPHRTADDFLKLLEKRGLIERVVVKDAGTLITILAYDSPPPKP